MSFYLDPSAILPTLIEQDASAAIDAFVLGSDGEFVVSDFAAAEVASALSRLIRIGELTAGDASARLADFDAWAVDTTPAVIGRLCNYKTIIIWKPMTGVRFEWDEAKNLSNQRKHDGVSFEEAGQLFQDPLHVSVQDRIEGGEQRWQTVGAVQGFVILVVAHTVTEEDADGGSVEIIRIISARRATPRERRRYENENG